MTGLISEIFPIGVVKSFWVEIKSKSVIELEAIPAAFIEYLTRCQRQNLRGAANT